MIENKEIFAENLNRYITISGKNRKEIAKALDVPYSTLTDWINGNKYPRIDSIEKMSIYFGVSKSDLIEDFKQKQKDNDAIADIIVKIRMNNDLIEVVKKVISLDDSQISSLKNLLDSFI